MNISEISNLFEGVQEIENGIKCLCPADEDKRQSLTITPKDGKLLMYCHANCRIEDILQKIGLSFSDLFIQNDDNSVTKEIQATKKIIQAIYSYYNEKGEYIEKYFDDYGNPIYESTR